MDHATAVKLNIYKTIADTTITPVAEDVARMMDSSVAEVESAFKELANQRLLVLEPGRVNRIRMAPPFSGIKTQHIVEIDGKSYHANCAWDALGVSAALGRDAEIASTCGDCGRSILIRVEGGKPIPQECVIHFAVPASRWWEDIIYT